MTSADYDFKILKELRADYQGEEDEGKETKETEQEQEQRIEGISLIYNSAHFPGFIYLLSDSKNIKFTVNNPIYSSNAKNLAHLVLAKSIKFSKFWRRNLSHSKIFTGITGPSRTP